MQEKRFVYLDNAATTKVRKEVVEAMLPFFTEDYGNASAIYSVGAKAKSALTNAREQVANVINANKEDIYFTDRSFFCGGFMLY